MGAAATLRAVLALAAKDLRLLRRNRGALFFALAWPVLLAVFFGLVFGGGGEKGRIPVAVVDEDASPESARLVAGLGRLEGLEVVAAARSEAEAQVRAGRKTAAVVVPRGYGEASRRLFRGATRRLEILVDPARTAEAAMLEGILTGEAMRSMQDLFTGGGAWRQQVDQAAADLEQAPPGQGREATGRFLGELRSFLETNDRLRAAGPEGAPDAERPAWKPVEVVTREVQVEREGPRSPFEITFPQGVLWGVIGSALGFAVSLVQERTRGTLSRLQTAPIGRGHVVAGKALACLATILAVEVLLFALARLGFGVRPASWGLLALAGGSVAACFVGIMMLVAVLGRTEQSAGGLGWAVMMPLTMFGGGMVPLFAMPRWMSNIGNLSPVKWGILALEGAIWRGFGLPELLLPCAVLVAVGLGCGLLGARLFARQG